jgi:hypothetical protein
MNSVNELMWKLDLTKLYVVSGDVPASDWIFNGESMVLAKNPHSDKQVAGDDERIKMVIPLRDKVRVVPKDAKESGPMREVVGQVAPWASTIAGAMLVGGPIGVLGGFAAGTFLTKNEACFECHLEDGRSFVAKADIKLMNRIQSISIKN